MDDENKKDEPKVQADNNSIAVGGISIGGSVGGNITIGHSGYTSDEVSVLITQIKSTFQPKPFDGRSPYKGLDVFDEEDAELFFGREKLVDDLVNRVKESRTVFITGPSGSGKSSLVRAGLIHALKQGTIKESNSERWMYATMKPGREPINTLARAVASLVMSTNAEDEIRSKAVTDETIFARWCEIALKDGRDKRVVLFIDQFEEVFTQISKEEERVAFLNLLTHAATVENGRVIILFSMRSDFVSNCATYPKLNALLNQQFVQIGAMQADELVSAIAQPALRVGLRIDPDLIAQIINDMQGEPGSLPLMQFALKDLFDSQQEKGGLIALTLNDYLQRGGIRKALERHADKTFAGFNAEEQELARSIFTGLIEIGRGTQDTRRTANFDELVPASVKSASIEAIVTKLADARLITTDEAAGKDTVTISHEKLIDAWPWLKKLVNENRDVIALQNEIAEDAKEWEEHQRDASYLYSGARLGLAQEQVVAEKILLSGLAKDFIDEGIKAKDAERKAKEILRKRITIGLISGIAIALVLAGFAVYQMLKAKEQSQVAIARQLVAQAQSILATRNSKQMIAGLLAIQSIKIFPSSGATQILLSNNLAARSISRITADGAVYSVAFSPDGKYFVSEGCDEYDQINVCIQGSARVWEALTGKEVSRMTHDDWVRSVAFSPDGKYIVSGSEDTTVRVWEAATGEEIARMTHDFAVNSAAFSPDGKYVVSGGDNTARVWETSTGKEVSRMTHDGEISSVAFSPDGKYVVSGDGHILTRDPFLLPGNDGIFTARVWEAATGREIARMTTDVVTSAFSPDGNYVVSGSWDGTALVWEVATGKEIARMTHDSWVTSVAFSPDGKYVVSGSVDGTARVWEAVTGKEVARMTHDGGVYSVAFSPDGKYVVSGSADNTARVWEALTGKEVSRMTHNAPVNSVAFSPDGKYVVSGSVDGTARVWAASAEKEITRIMMHGDVTYVSFTFSPDGKYVVSPKCDKYDNDNNCVSSSTRVWDVFTGQEVANRIYDGDVPSFAFSPDSKHMMTWKCDQYDSEFRCVSSSVLVWEALTGKEVAHRTYDGDVSSLAFSPDSKHVISGQCDQYDNDYNCISSSAHVWEALTGQEVARQTYDGDVPYLDFSPDSKHVISWKCDQYDNDYNCISSSAIVWEALTGKEVAHRTDDGDVPLFAFSPDGKHVVSWKCDQLDNDLNCVSSSALVWEALTGKEVAHQTYDGDVPSVAFSPDGKYVVSWKCDKYANEFRCISSSALVWEALTGKEVVHRTYDGDVPYLAFSPDAKYVVAWGCQKFGAGATCTQGSIQVWEALTGKVVAHRTYDGLANSVAFSPDSKYVVSGSEDGTASVWEAASGKEVARITHDGTVTSVAFSRDGKYVVSEGDGTARVWFWQPEDLIADACARLSRNLTPAEWEQYIGDALPYQAVCENLPIEPEVTSTPTVTP